MAHDQQAFDDASLKRRLDSYDFKFLLTTTNYNEFSATLLQNTEYLEQNADILDEESLNGFIYKTEKAKNS